VATTLSNDYLARGKQTHRDATGGIHRIDEVQRMNEV
jgi:hypothetical protein